MSEPSIQDYIQTIVSSGLISSEELQGHYEAYLETGGKPEQTLKFAKYLQSNKILTRWQNSMLLAGKYKGLKFGKFRMLKLLGLGGMGRVFLAEHEIMRRQVALKILPSEKSKRTKALQRFYLEARALAQLDHENVVRVHDVSNEGSRHYIVMEYVSGTDLHRKVSKEGPLEPETAINYVRQTALGLAHAHAANLIHRDIKPANLLLTESGVIKILDLGLALLQTDVEAVTEDPNKSVGTADFVSPQQAHNESDLDHRTDIYSLGCTLFYLLAGQAPFKRNSVSGRLRAHKYELPPSINQIRKTKGLDPIAPELAILCGRMMAKRPEDRFESAEAVIAAIDELFESDGEDEEEVDSEEILELPSDDDWWDDDSDEFVVDEHGKLQTNAPPSPSESSDTPAGNQPASTSGVAGGVIVTQQQPGVSSANPAATAGIQIQVESDLASTDEKRQESRGDRRGRKRKTMPPVMIWTIVALVVLVIVVLVVVIAGG